MYMIGSFFNGLFSRIVNLFDSSDLGAEKDRFLKNMNKELGKTKSNFYKYGSNEVTPQMAKFFFDIYETVEPAQKFFKKTVNPNSFKNMVIDYYLSDQQKELEKKFDEQAINERAKRTPIKELTEQVKQELSIYLKEFDGNKITTIDSTYTKLSLLIDFCTFDYFFLLKKFAPSMEEGMFKEPPKFRAIPSENILGNVKDFTASAWAVLLVNDWGDVFNVIKKYRNVQPISPSLWNRILQLLRKLQEQSIFEMIIQLSTKDPGYKIRIDKQKIYIIDAQLDATKKVITTTLQKIHAQQKNSKIDELRDVIFGAEIPIRLKHYTDTANSPFEKKSLQTYEFCTPLNYLKVFLVDYYKKNIREFADIVLVRGKWALSALSIPMSEAYHELLTISEKINKLDAELKEDAEIGAKIKVYIARADRDREIKNILNSLVDTVNKDAHEILSSATKNLIIIAKNTKIILEDIDRKKPELITNWEELSHFTEHPIKDMGIDIYKKIHYFVILMKFFIKNEE